MGAHTADRDTEYRIEHDTMGEVRVPKAGWVRFCNADVNAARNIAAGHAVTARGCDGVARPVNREPQLLLLSA